MVRVMGKTGAFGAGGGVKQRHGWLSKDNEVIPVREVFINLADFDIWWGV